MQTTLYTGSGQEPISRNFGSKIKYSNKTLKNTSAGPSQQTSPFEYSCDLHSRFTSTCMTKKKRNSTRKKILTNSQDKNINATFTKTAIFSNKENYCDWSVIENFNFSCLKIDPASCWRTSWIVKEEKYITLKIWSCWSLGWTCLKFHSNNNFVIIIKKSLFNAHKKELCTVLHLKRIKTKFVP